jgi:hypothetical protein
VPTSQVSGASLNFSFFLGGIFPLFGGCFQIVVVIVWPWRKVYENEAQMAEIMGKLVRSWLEKWWWRIPLSEFTKLVYVNFWWTTVQMNV